MIIDRAIFPYVCVTHDSISTALEKISKNKARFVCCVTEHGKLEGVLTDGDFRRWLLEQEETDLSQPVGEICNRVVHTVVADTPPEEIASLFSDAITFVPVVDAFGRLVAVARPSAPEIRIEEFVIGAGQPAFLIAEIGINHNGSLELAKQLIDEAQAAGADCAKFQMRNLTELYRNAGDTEDVREDLGTQYTLEVLARSMLSDEDMLRCFDHCRKRGILPLCTPWDLHSLRVLEDYGMPAFKVASPDLTNHDLLRAMAAIGKPMILSTGMSREGEIRETVTLLRKLGAPFVLLHCNSAYPAPFKDVNLRYLEKLRKIGGCPVGYSGHERGFAIPVAAVAQGAKVIEKHLTIDRAMEGNDHKVSLLPAEFAQMVEAIRNVEEAMGSGGTRRLTQGERLNRVSLAKSVVAAVPIETGSTIRRDMIEIKSPGRGLQPNRAGQLVGSIAKRDLVPGDFFYESDLTDVGAEPRPYQFARPWGVPVRYHDYAVLLGKVPHVDLLEFHLSYKDMDQDMHQFFDRSFDLELVVHSPDLFAGDHLLNLAAEDEQYRARSIAELQRTLDVVRDMRQYFTQTERVKVVASLGGFTKDAPLPREERAHLYDLVADSLSRLDQTGVELLLQTLPPYPWYFGGQLYCNLFVDADEIAAFCEQRGNRVCLDVSHAKLTCNDRNASFKEYVDLVAPHAAHLHVVDASGTDSEGLQIGEGEVDFAQLADQLGRLCPQASFIPEIWQGHKNEGEGFWVALDRLEHWF